MWRSCSNLSQELCATNLAAPRIENPSGDPFDLLSAGPAAKSVPSQAVTVDDSSPDIIYHNESNWSRKIDSLRYYDSGISLVWIPGTSLSYSFDGVAIWYSYLYHTIQ